MPEPGGTSSSLATRFTSWVNPDLCWAVFSWGLNRAVSVLDGMGPDALRKATISCSVTPPGSAAAADADADGDTAAAAGAAGGGVAWESLTCACTQH